MVWIAWLIASILLVAQANNQPLPDPDRTLEQNALRQSAVQFALYQGLSTSGQCKRLLDSDRIIGCSDNKSPGTPGIVRWIATAQEFNTFISTVSQTPDTQLKWTLVLPYAAFLEQVVCLLIYCRGNLQQLSQQRGDIISGIILLKADNTFSTIDNRVLDRSNAYMKTFGQKPSVFSSDDSIPNKRFSLYKNDNNAHVWNPNGNGYKYMSFGFPIFTMYATDRTANASMAALIQAGTINSQKQHSSYPLYAIQFDSRMNAAVNTETCLRRGLCDPIGSWSVWSSFQNLSAPNSNSIIALTSQLDADNFITGVPSVGSSFTGAIALMAMADALSKSSPSPRQFKKTILFQFFSSEAYGYAGSKSLVRDISSFECKRKESHGNCKAWSAGCTDPCIYNTDFTNIQFDKIEGILDMTSLLSLHNGDGPSRSFYLHVHDPNDAQVNSLLGRLEGTFTGSGNDSFQVKKAYTSGGSSPHYKLPPSSLHAFLEKKLIPSVLISDYQDAFSNPYYNTELDDGASWNSSHVSQLCGISTVATRMVWSWANSDDSNFPAAPPTLSVNCTLVQVLLECFTRNLTCSYLQQIYGSTVMQETSYPGTFQHSNRPSFRSYFVYQIMSNSTGSPPPGNTTCNQNSDCDEPSGYFCLFKRCIHTVTRFHPAYGPGLKFDLESGTYKVQDAQQSVFTESKRYFNSRMRLFLVPSAGYSGGTLAFGVCWSLLFVALVYYAKNILKKNKQE